MKVKDNI